VDDDPLHVADDQIGRVPQVEGIGLQLAWGGVQIAAPALVLPAETAPAPDVRPAVAPPTFYAPRSKQNPSPRGSSSAGVGSPSSRQRSIICSWEPCRSCKRLLSHFRWRHGGPGSGGA
jgi:hypothetical protein